MADPIHLCHWNRTNIADLDLQSDPAWMQNFVPLPNGKIITSQNIKRTDGLPENTVYALHARNSAGVWVRESRMVFSRSGHGTMFGYLPETDELVIYHEVRDRMFRVKWVPNVSYTSPNNPAFVPYGGRYGVGESWPYYDRKHQIFLFRQAVRGGANYIVVRREDVEADRDNVIGRIGPIPGSGGSWGAMQAAASWGDQKLFYITGDPWRPRRFFQFDFTTGRMDYLIENIAWWTGADKYQEPEGMFVTDEGLTAGSNPFVLAGAVLRPDLANPASQFSRITRLTDPKADFADA